MANIPGKTEEIINRKKKNGEKANRLTGILSTLANTKAFSAVSEAKAVRCNTV